MSPISDWEGASVVFTFGADSVGVWLSLAVALGIGVGVIARMIRDENRTFASQSPNLTQRGALEGANI